MGGSNKNQQKQSLIYPMMPFTQEDLEVHWKIYQQEKTDKREQNLASLFQLSTPQNNKQHHP